MIAKVIGIGTQNAKPHTAYDPTCGSGSLLLKVAAEAGKHITLEGRRESSAVRVGGCHRILAEVHPQNALDGGVGARCHPRPVAGRRDLRSEATTVASAGSFATASAAVPGADVVLANEDTGVVRATTTNGVGEYAFRQRQSRGRHTCGPRSPGFKAFESPGPPRRHAGHAGPLTSCCRWATSASRSSSLGRRRSSSARARHSE